MAPPEAVVALAAELTRAGADWQIHAYGNILHGFTNPNANDPERGVLYDAAADRRSWTALEAFLGETLA
jgi:dienelactone hydrolase